MHNNCWGTRLDAGMSGVILSYVVATRGLGSHHYVTKRTKQKAGSKNKKVEKKGIARKHGKSPIPADILVKYLNPSSVMVIQEFNVH